MIPVTLPSNEIYFRVMSKDGDQIKDMKESDRCRLVVCGERGVVLAEMLRTLASWADFAINEPVWEVPLLGVITARPAYGNRFSDVLMADAPLEVKIRRDSWPLTRMATYINKGGFFILHTVEIPSDGSGGFRRDMKPLTPIDFAAEDWRIIENPNIHEEEFYLPPEPHSETKECQDVQ